MPADVAESTNRTKTSAAGPLRVSLHIGSTKTGSSALQHILYANRAALQKSAVLYPDIGVVSNAHHALLGAIHPGAWALHKDQYDIEKFDFFKRGVKQAIDLAQATDCKHLVLSSEYFWGQFGQAVYDTVREALAGCNVRVFCCLRDVKRWRESSYLQALKNGEKRGFRQWFEQEKDKRVRGFDFNGVIDSWVDGLDAASFSYTRYKFETQDAFMRQVFFDLTGVELETMPTQEIKGTVNPSPTHEGMILLRDMNRQELPDSDRRKQVSKILRAHSRPPNFTNLYFPKQHFE